MRVEPRAEARPAMYRPRAARSSGPAVAAPEHLRANAVGGSQGKRASEEAAAAQMSSATSRSRRVSRCFKLFDAVCVFLKWMAAYVQMQCSSPN